MLSASLFDAPLELRIDGEVPSQSFVDLTVSVLESFGVEVSGNERGYRVSNDRPRCTEYRVDGDGAGASYFWGAAAVTGGRVRVHNIAADSAQGDVLFVDALEAMGCGVRRQDDWIEVEGPVKLRATDVDLSALPDTAQTLAVVAAFAEGTTRIRGLETLPHKETDRLSAVVTELAGAGIVARADADSLTVEGGAPSSTTVRTYGDHRMAMAFSLLGARVEGVRIEDPAVVAKSFPSFWERMRSIGIDSDGG